MRLVMTLRWLFLPMILSLTLLVACSQTDSTTTTVPPTSTVAVTAGLGITPVPKDNSTLNPTVTTPLTTKSIPESLNPVKLLEGVNADMAGLKSFRLEGEVVLRATEEADDVLLVTEFTGSSNDEGDSQILFNIGAPTAVSSSSPFVPLLTCLGCTPFLASWSTVKMLRTQSHGFEGAVNKPIQAMIIESIEITTLKN